MGLQERRKREKQERKDQILNAARAVLFVTDIASISMNQVAAAAELSVGTLYIYFKNKEELFARLQEEGLDILFEMVKKAIDTKQEPRQQLRSIALAYLEFSRQHRKYFDLMNYFLTSPEVTFPERLKSRVDDHGARILKLVEKVLAGFSIDSGANQDKSRRCSIVFWSSVHGLIQFKKLQKTILGGEDFLELYHYNFECIIKALETELSEN